MQDARPGCEPLRVGAVGCRQRRRAGGREDGHRPAVRRITCATGLTPGTNPRVVGAEPALRGGGRPRGAARAAPPPATSLCLTPAQPSAGAGTEAHVPLPSMWPREPAGVFLKKKSRSLACANRPVVAPSRGGVWGAHTGAGQTPRPQARETSRKTHRGRKHPPGRKKANDGDWHVQEHSRPRGNSCPGSLKTIYNRYFSMSFVSDDGDFCDP